MQKEREQQKRARAATEALDIEEKHAEGESEREQQRKGLAVAEALDIEEKRAERESAAKAGSRGCKSVRCRRETCRVRERARENSKGRLARLQKR